MPNGPTDLIEIQVAPSAPQPSVTATGTDLVLPPKRSADRLRHFSEEIYDITPESHLSRFLKVLLGDAGAGLLRKRINIQRMRATLQGSHFYDLDRFYGPLFGIKRVPDEQLQINPYVGTATREQWDDALARDASFRSRIEQFASAIAYGPTPVGMELIAEALLAVDCEIHESYIQADELYQTYGEIEAGFATYGDIEGITWGELEGLNGTQLFGNERRVFIVRPKRPITEADAYFLGRVLDRLKPADARYEIDTSGIILHEPLGINGVFADSEHWEVVSKVVPFTPATNLPYTVISGDPEEQPRPPFSGYQGEAWSYVTDLAGVVASYKLPGTDVSTTSPLQRVTYHDGTDIDFSPEQAILPARVIQSGRGASDAILVAYPYATQFGILDQFAIDRTAEAIGQLYADGVPLEALNRILDTLPRTDPFQQNPENRYWVSPVRSMNDPMEEVLEIRLQRESWVNYITFEAVKYPHRVIVEMYDTEGGVWIEAFQQEFTEAFPKFLNPGEEIALRSGHPQHAYPNHWEKVSRRVTPQLTSRVRVRLRRIEGIPPRQRLHTTGQTAEVVDVDYSLALRSMDVGYRVSTREDFAVGSGEVLGQTADIVGSQVYFEINEQEAALAVDDSEVTAWRSEPQPVPYSVVNFYLDTRDEDGINGKVIDRFYVNPTHAGPSLSIYYSNDPYWPEGKVLFLNGAGYAVTPNSPEFQIADDIDIRVKVGLESWSGIGDEQTFVSKRNVPVNIGGDEWQFRTQFNNGRIQFVFWDLAGDPQPFSATVDTGFEPGSVHWIRCTRSGTSLTFYTSDDETNDHEEVVWTQLGDVVVVPAGDMRSTVANSMTIGSLGASVVTNEPVRGTVFAVAVLANSTVVANPVFADWEEGQDSREDDQGHLWTLAGSAVIVGDQGSLSEKFFEDLNWQPIPRNYFLQKGYIHIPPTRARFFKFEFSNLTAEPYESFIPIMRTVKLFPEKLINDLGISYGHAEEARLPGMTMAISAAESLRYRDALRALGRQALPLVPGTYRPTEALYVPDPAQQTSLRHEAWQFGFIPWHQSSEQYPRFNTFGKHSYETIQVLHDTKVAFFVGLREIKAYRTRFEEDENTVTYLDTFDDFRNLTLPFNWAFDPGFLTSEGHQIPTSAMSRVFYSKDNVKAIQFATVQSDPVQLIFDHTFRDPALQTYLWDDPDNFQRVGDAQLIYDKSDFSVVNIRHVIPPPKAVTRSGTIVQPIVSPVFRQEDFQVADDAAAAETIGGLMTGAVPLSTEGRAYAAARFTMMTDQSSPIYLRVYDDDGDVLLAEREFTARKGETVEGYIGFNIPDDATAVYIQLVQEGKSDDLWKVYALSLFDEGMIWEFSVDGGSNWYPAMEIRNNENGILTFPRPGNQLRYRLRGFRDNRWVSAIKIRPHYVETGNARPTGTNRGPNVSVYDHDVPIQADPLFTTWTEPIPYWWFAASRRFPLLSAEGSVNLTQFSRFFSRPNNDDVSGLTDEATAEVTAGRLGVDNVSVIGDVAARTGMFGRLGADDIHVPNALSMKGSGSLTTPDSVDLSISDDIDIRVRASFYVFPEFHNLAIKHAGTPDWVFRITSGNSIQFQWWDTSGVLHEPGFFPLPGLPSPGHPRWYRVTRSGATVNFYISDSAIPVWTLIGSAVTATGSIRDTATELSVGPNIEGAIYAFELYDGIDGVLVAELDFDQPPWTLTSTSEDDSLGNTWTIGGGAEVLGQQDEAKAVFVWQLGVAGRSELGETTYLGD